MMPWHMMTWQEMQIKPRLEKAFKRGLAQAALATNAWIVTGGTDSGVMSLVGHGLAEYAPPLSTAPSYRSAPLPPSWDPTNDARYG